MLLLLLLSYKSIFIFFPWVWMIIPTHSVDVEGHYLLANTHIHNYSFEDAI